MMRQFKSRLLPSVALIFRNAALLDTHETFCPAQECFERSYFFETTGYTYCDILCYTLGKCVNKT